MSSVPDRRFVDELFEDTEKKYKQALPDAVAVQASSFERFAHRYVLMAVGFNASVLGLIWFAHDDASQRSAVGLLALILFIAIASLNRLNRGIEDFPVARAHGTALTFLVLAALAIGPWWGLLAMMCVVSPAIATGRIAQSSAAEVAVYFPLGLQVFSATEDARALAGVASAALMFGIFLVARKRVAAFWAVVLLGVVAVCEVGRQVRGESLATSVAVLALAAAMLYEVGPAILEHSKAKLFVRLSVPVLVGYVVVWSLHGTLPLSLSALLWYAALAIACYEGLQSLRKQDEAPLRIVWAAIAVSVALAGEKTLTPAAYIAAYVSLFMLVHVLALRLSSKVLERVAVVGICLVALASASRSDEAYVGDMAAAALCTFLAMLTLANCGTIQPEPSPRHVVPNRYGVLRRTTLVVVGTLLRLPIVNWIFFWAKTGFLWLRYVKGERPLGFADLLLVAAHAYAITLLGKEIPYLLHLANVDGGYRFFASTMAGLVWGLVVTLSGVYMGDIFRRVLGIAIVLVVSGLAIRPLVKEAHVAGPLLLVLMGVALWLGSWAVMKSRSRAPAAPSAQETEVIEASRSETAAPSLS